MHTADFKPPMCMASFLYGNLQIDFSDTAVCIYRLQGGK